MSSLAFILSFQDNSASAKAKITLPQLEFKRDAESMEISAMNERAQEETFSPALKISRKRKSSITEVTSNEFTHQEVDYPLLKKKKLT